MKRQLMVDEIRKHVKELQNAITVAELNYEIWWVYREKESRKRFVDVLNAYPHFFKISLHAHFVAMIFSLYRLYETRKDTINLPRLLRLLKNHGTIPIQEIKRIESEINNVKPLWVKVAILRNNMFGHKSNALDYAEILKLASVKPNQFKKLIDESERILNETTNLLNKSGHFLNQSATKDTVDLLEDLKKLVEERWSDGGLREC